MTANNGSVWSRDASSEIDQCDVVLPPAWLRRREPPAVTFTSRAGIHRSEKGRTAARAIAADIDRARRMVVVTSFLFGDREIVDAILRAAGNGVRVYLLMASETRLEKEPRENKRDQQVVAEHLALLQRLAGRVLIRSSLAYHAKLVLVDPAEAGPGWLLTSNLTSEALERNEEIAVQLSAAEAATAFEAVRWAAWEIADHQLLAPGKFRPVEPQLRVERPTTSGPLLATLDMPGSLQTETLRLIETAGTEIVVASFGWDASHPVVQRLSARAREGLRVTVLARERGAAMPALLDLKKAGARVLGFEFLHAKAIWTDRARGIVSSANWQRKGLDEGFELGVVLDGERADTLRELLTQWADAATSELHLAPRLGDVDGAASVWSGAGLVEFEPVERVERHVGEFVAESADRLDVAAPALPKSDLLPLAARRVTLRWRVSAPRLAKTAKPLDGPGPRRKGRAAPSGPPRFRESSGRVVVAVADPQEIDAARRAVAAGAARAIVVKDRTR
jgi:cardiolipin synthase